MEKQKIGIAMSGGVDSTVCALLLKENYQVHGFFMRLAQPDFTKQLDRVQKIADRCDIPLQVIDLRQPFTDKVLDYFTGAYRNGITPNPCMVCNPAIKFGLFMDAIMEYNIVRIATGHYANIVRFENCFYVKEGKDHLKDQSYFLARLSQKQLSQVIFPLGGMTKEAVYLLAEQQGFHHFRGQESQDICFMNNQSVGSFLETRGKLSPAPGDIIDTAGNIRGQHTGIYNYTIGQRKGLGISAPAPLYVTGLDAGKNRVIVGENDALFANTVKIKNTLWNCGRPPSMERKYRVRIRYGHKGEEAAVEKTEDGQWEITFTRKQRAVTPGQFAVIYDQDLIIGSGEIV